MALGTDFGAQVRIRFVIGVSVQWSVRFWATIAGTVCINVAAGCLTFKELVMNKLHAIVAVGVTLLPVPGRVDGGQLG